MNKPTENLKSIAEQIRLTFSFTDAAREKALPLCRDAIRHCSQAIRSIHRHEFDQAESLLGTAHILLSEAKLTVNDFSELRNTGFLRDAQKELAEGAITLAIVTGKQPPTPDELGIDPAAYLKGMGEAAGELRRYLLDSMREDDLSQGAELLSAMDDIYNILITMDFPAAITNGLRHTTDMVRGILERTRSDLTLVMRQKALEHRLREFNERLSAD